MRLVSAALLVFFCAWLQASPLNDLLYWQFDLLLAVVIVWAVGVGPRRGLMIGLLAGAVQDILIGGGLTYTVLKALLGLMAGGLRPFLHDRQGIVVVPLVFVLSLLQDAAVALLLGIQGFGIPWSQQISIALPVAAGTALLSWPLALGVRWVLHKTRNPWALREGLS
jgi:rod shape-determining protein MreD